MVKEPILVRLAWRCGRRLNGSIRWYIPMFCAASGMRSGSLKWFADGAVVSMRKCTFAGWKDKCVALAPECTVYHKGHPYGQAYMVLMRYNWIRGSREGFCSRLPAASSLGIDHAGVGWTVLAPPMLWIIDKTRSRLKPSALPWPYMQGWHWLSWAWSLQGMLQGPSLIPIPPWQTTSPILPLTGFMALYTTHLLFSI